MQGSVRSAVRQIHEEGLFRFRLSVLYNPFLSKRGEQVRSVRASQFLIQTLFVVKDGFACAV